MYRDFMVKEIVLKGAATFVFKEIWNCCSGHWNNKRLKEVVDLLHKEYFFNKKFNSLKTDVRISVFGKSNLPFAKKYVLKARSLDLDQKSKKKFTKSKTSSGPFDGVVGHILSKRTPYIEHNLPCYKTGSAQDKIEYMNKTHMNQLSQSEIENFKYFARSYFGVFVQDRDAGVVKFVILLESEKPNYFGKGITSDKIIRSFHRFFGQL